jgi:hypothetical protein
MSWSIENVINTVKISKSCASDIYDAESYTFEEKTYNDTFGSVEDVTYKGKLLFNSDHGEHMDYVSNRKVQEALKKHKVKGDICFGSLEGDNAGQFWGYRFDGKGGMQELIGKIAWNPR